MKLKKTLLISLSTIGLVFNHFGQTNCIDYSDNFQYPNAQFSTDTIIDNSSASVPLSISNNTGNVTLNDPIFQGVYGSNATLNFSFNGSSQTINFNKYGFQSQFSQMSFTVNGSSNHLLSETFPQTINGITVDIQNVTPIAATSMVSFDMTFSGLVSTVTYNLFESGVTNLCVSTYEECTNFTNTSEFTTASYSNDTSITNTFIPIDIINNSGIVLVNDPSFQGIYGSNADLNFTFSGSSQIATFSNYGFQSQFNQMGFSVNGSSIHFLNETFPQTINGILVDLQNITPIAATSMVSFDMTFSGLVSIVSFNLFESGFTNLCSISYDPSLIVSTVENDLEVYPNPINEILNLKTKEIFEQIEIYSLDGVSVFKKQTSTNEFQINTSDFHPGYYLLKITSKSGISVMRFLKV